MSLATCQRGTPSEEHNTLHCLDVAASREARRTTALVLRHQFTDFHTSRSALHHGLLVLFLISIFFQGDAEETRADVSKCDLWGQTDSQQHWHLQLTNNGGEKWREKTREALLRVESTEAQTPILRWTARYFNEHMLSDRERRRLWTGN